MQVRRIHTFNDLAHQRLAWNCLSHGVPFRSWEWNQCWWNHYGRGLELMLLAVFDEREQLVGLAPWYVEPTMGVRHVRFLGSGDVCSDYLTLLTTAEHEDAVVSALSTWLVEANQRRDREQDRWDVLQLAGIAKGDTTVSKLAQQLTAAGSRVVERDVNNCWRLELPTTWLEYEERLSKSHRKQVRRVDRRLLETGRAILKTVSQQDELAQGLKILVDLHQKRRRVLDQPGCFANSQFTEFVFDFAKEMLSCDRLQLHWVELDGRPVACEFQLEGNQTTYAYQAGIDPEVLDEEPGRLINVATLKRAIARQQTAFDFLRGDEPYKAHWRAVPIPQQEWRIIGNRSVSQVWAGMWLAKDAMKSWVKTGLQMTGIR